MEHTAKVCLSLNTDLSSLHQAFSVVLRVQLATADQMLKELPMAQQCRPIAATCLIPLPQPQQGNNFLLGEAALDKRVSFRFDRFYMCFHFLFLPLCSCDRLCLPQRGFRTISASYRIREKSADNLAPTYHLFNKELLWSSLFTQLTANCH